MEEILKVLVVDDDEVDRMAVRRALSKAETNLEISEAEDCASAIAALQQHPFNCVFLDYRLPDGNGLTLVQSVRQAGIKVPLVVLTGQGDERIAVEVMKAGAADYLSKSRLSEASLSRTLRNAVRIHRAEMQVALATQKLLDSEERYRFVLEGSNDGIWDWDIIKNKVYWNDRLLNIVGLSRSEFGNRPSSFYQLIHPEDRRRTLIALMSHLDRGFNYNIEFRLRHSSGNYRYCICRGKAQRNEWGKPLRMAGIVSDITERKWIEETLQISVRNARQHAVQLRGLTDAALSINSALTLEEVLHVITEQARSIIGAHQSVTSLNVDDDWSQAINAVSLSDKYEAWRNYDEPTNGSGIYSLICRMNRPLRMTQAELEAHPAWKNFGKSANTHPPMRGWLAAPLTGRNGQNVGLIQLSDKYEGDFTENDEAIIVQLAQMASVALENARLFRATQEAEEQLRHQLQFTTALTNSLGEGVYALDRAGALTFMNPAAEKILGWTEEELIGKAVQEFIRFQRTNGAFVSMTEGEPLTEDGLLTQKNGRIFPVAYTFSPIVAEGQVVGTVVAFRDITERKQLEDALRESESRFRRVVESNMVGIGFWDVQGNITEANDAFLDMVGYTREDLLAGEVSWGEMTPVEYRSLDKIGLAESSSTGVYAPFEKEFIRKDGSRIPILIGGALLDEGVPERGVCFVLNITERKQAEEALRETNQTLETLIQASPLPIVAFDPNVNIRIWNPAAERVFGWSEQEVIGSPFPTVPEDQRKEGIALYEESFRGYEVTDLETRRCRKDGTLIDVSVSLAPLRDARGIFRGMVAVFADITERKRAEEAQRFLVEASTLLSASLDYQTTLENLARLAVPDIADWCIVDVLEQNQTLQRVAVAHADPAKAQQAHELQYYYPPDLTNPTGVARVLRTGKPEFYVEVANPLLVATARDPEHLERLQELDFQSVMCVPLLARGRTLGVITLILAESGRRHTQADLSLVEDLARRAALAVDNARLYREAQEAERNLRQVIAILGEQQQQLRTLQRLTNLLNQRLANLPGLLQVMVDAMCAAIPRAEFGLIVLQDSQRQVLELTATAGIGVEKLQADEPFYAGEGLLGQVFLTGESQLLQGQPVEPELVADMPAAICAVAIESAQAGRLGVLALGNWKDTVAFSEDDQRLLIAFGEQAAIAINNAQLINTLEEREERLAVQNNLLARQNRELEQQRQQIQRQNIQLQEAARLKSQFLATMSHELRTPMNAVIGFSQLLLRQRQNPLIPQQMDMVARILNNGKNLLTLINDILDLSKIEAGHLKLKLEEFNLVNLITSTTEEIRSLAEQKHLTLQVQADVQNPQVMNDSVRLRQILVNLLSNAIKFTESGSVTVSVWEPASDRLAIAVRDTGIGIAQDDLKHIFEEFRQVDQTTTRKYSGTGLGLAITDWLVDLMNGTIQVESQVGQGSTFQVEFPRQIELKNGA